MFGKEKKLSGFFCSECGRNESDLEDFTIHGGTLYCYNCYHQYVVKGG